MFQACPPDDQCAYCRKLRAPPAIADVADAVYCINIEEQPERFAAAQELFHAEGLCQAVVFYRPKRGRSSNPAIWASHQAVAREALRRGQSRILVLEDDIRLFKPWVDILATARRALPKLPPDWRALYLGHWPVRAYFAAWGVLRTASGTTHAYIANLPLLRWLDATEPMDPYLPLRPHTLGRGIDSALSHLPGMFAVFPMGIGQQWMTEIRDGAKAGLFDFRHWRIFVIVWGMRPAEWIAALLSPAHWLRMRGEASAGEIPAAAQAEIRESFDAAYYLERYPDVAAADFPPLAHFVQFGAREGRAPNRWFDPVWYLEQYPQARDEKLNAFEHYVVKGKALGYLPNPEAASVRPTDGEDAARQATQGGARNTTVALSV